MINHYQHPEYLAQIAGIRTQPEDDLRRLVLADWLEDHGDCDRAEFIRLQIEQWQVVEDRLGDSVDRRGVDRVWLKKISTRTRSLLRKNKARWCHPFRPMEPKESGLVGQWAIGLYNCTLRVRCSADDRPADPNRTIHVEFTRGFLRMVYGNSEWLTGHQCWRCEGVGYIGYWTGDGQQTPVDWEEQICPWCDGRGGTSPIADEIYAREPVTEVMLADRYPAQNPDGEGWFWSRDNGEDVSGCSIDGPVFDLLPGKVKRCSSGIDRKEFPDLGTALHQASAAILFVAADRIRNRASAV